jgi:hypothetical protein
MALAEMNKKWKGKHCGNVEDSWLLPIHEFITRNYAIKISFSRNFSPMVMMLVFSVEDRCYMCVV